MKQPADFSPSWKRLTALTDERTMWEFDAYYQRVHPLVPNVPRAVLKQWIHGLQGEYVTMRNYAWLDYDHSLFSLEQWPTQGLLNLYVVEEYRDCVQTRERCQDFEEFCCTNRDLVHWKAHGTWRTPPVVLDVVSLGQLPPDKELVVPHQLIEGHNRLGYLLAMAGMAQRGEAIVAVTHDVWVLRGPGPV
ncbi:hypothetical protein MTP16_24310 (plasmid) [Hymenobacter monticola]|uniref:Uncharacterized protein n=1 Tax=Hymenobacter monticola TaxID=1705399 RepID=A0ABY4BE99_9BACT|nr:hypothetical protein [Hymenobacter monticola]UOE36617.1 hypothetical protein MTP16_24310 [Hymenobacter monticola]